LDFPSNKASLFAFLQEGRDFPHFKLLDTIRYGEHFSHIYRFIPPPETRHQPPYPPQKPIFPKNGSTIFLSAINPDLCWEESIDPDNDGILRYRIQFSLYPDCRYPLAFEAEIKLIRKQGERGDSIRPCMQFPFTSESKLGQLLREHAHKQHLSASGVPVYWRVQARDDRPRMGFTGYDSYWSSVFRFHLYFN